jgi:hypothetical protein
VHSSKNVSICTNTFLIARMMGWATVESPQAFLRLHCKILHFLVLMINLWFFGTLLWFSNDFYWLCKLIYHWKFIPSDICVTFLWHFTLFTVHVFMIFIDLQWFSLIHFHTGDHRLFILRYFVCLWQTALADYAAIADEYLESICGFLNGI